MAEAYLLLGSNLGDREQFLLSARHAISSRIGTVLAASALYETAAWGKTDQSAFLNQVLLVQTGLHPSRLLAEIHGIERDLGRERKEKWAARVVDIDILFYGNQILSLPDLTIPHPELHRRRFTLVPLAELDPDLLHPVLGLTVLKLLERCPDSLEVVVFKGGAADVT
jgi:2-amino-4-hydroxy-6-hydroxymethyldihydropteridine diphosphokinase